MEVISIESEAFKIIVDKIDKIAGYVVINEQIAKNESIDNTWMDSYEVAKLLKISTRTLQRLRRDNLITYTRLRGRCLYKLSEIYRCLEERLIKCDAETIEEFKSNYVLNLRK